MDYAYGFGFLTVGIVMYFVLKPKKITKEEMEKFEFLKKAEAEEKEKNK